MNMVEFKIPQSDRESEGIVEIARRMRVACLEGDRFLVAESGLAVRPTGHPLHSAGAGAL